MLQLVVCSVASAHMGLPESSNLTAREARPDALFVGTTFGAVLSPDGGQSWRWICPEAIGYGAWRPEAYVWKANGRILAATGNGLIQSDDDACTWSRNPAFNVTWASGLATHPDEPTLLYVSSARAGGSDSGVYRSDDLGETFRHVLARDDLTFRSVVVSPATAERVYASAFTAESPRTAVLFRSDDGGGSWSEQVHRFTVEQGGNDLVLLAGSPASPGVLFARLYFSGRSHLLRSEDGGTSFTEVLSVADYVHGVEVSPDGETVWASTFVHLYRSGDGGRTFEALLEPEGNACARWVNGKLYGCGSPWVHGWSVAESSDLGSAWTPLFTFAELEAPTHCPVGTPTRDLCEPILPQLMAVLLPEEPPPVDGPITPGAPAAPEAPMGCGCSGGATGASAFLAWVPFWILSRRRR